MKLAFALVLGACLFAAVVFVAEADGSYDIVDCKPKEKGCPYGFYCVYYPDKKCKTFKECKKEKGDKKCVEYKYVTVSTGKRSYGYGGYGSSYKKEKKCVKYDYHYFDKCYDKQVCYEFVCAKLAPGYY